MKGIDPKAREIAKVLARRSGMTLGEWLNQVILEDNPPSEDPAPSDYGVERYGSPRRSTLFSRDRDSYRRHPAPEPVGDSMAKVGDALDRLSARIEAAELRSAQAINGIDQSVSSLVARLSVAEREQTVVAARFEGAVEDLRTDNARMAERLRRAEQDAAGSRTAEAIKSVEGALAKVASQLYEGDERTRAALTGLRRDVDGLNGRVEAELSGVSTPDLIEAVVARLSERLEQAELRTSTALRSLETSFGALDQRLVAAEQRIEGRASEVGLQQLAANLSERVEAARTEMAEKIRTTADGRIERLERTLEEMDGHVQVAERRQAQAIERMGHEVLRMADVLGRKVSDVEARSAGAIEQVSGEVRRMAETMESRMDRADMIGAAALERLGGEIARITERLAERIGDAERRSAQAMDDVGEQLSRATDRMQDRQDRVTSELSERIRQSEERTARLLEDARTRIDERLAETNRRLEAKPAAPEPPAYAAPYGPSYAGPAFAGQAYVAPAYTPPVYGEPIYLDPDVAPFGHDSFAASRPPAAPAPAPTAELIAPEPIVSGPIVSGPVVAEPVVAEAAFGAPEAQDAEEIVPHEPETVLLAEPDFHEPSFAAHAARVDEPAEALDPFLSPAEVIAATAALADEHKPDSLARDWPVQAAQEEPELQPETDPRALPGATFASQPFVVHATSVDAWSPTTETYVTTPVRAATEAPALLTPTLLTDDQGDDDLDAPEPASLAGQPHLRDVSAADDLEAEAEALFAPRSTATRDMLDQARAATRAAAAARPEGRGRARARDFFSGPALRQPPRRRQASAWTNAFLMSGAAAAIGVSVAGYAILNEKPMGAPPRKVADAAPAKPVADLGAPILATALTTKPEGDASADAPAPLAAPAAPNPEAVSLYGDASMRLKARDFTGVEALKKSANLGYAPAQFYLAKLYENGAGGLRRDTAEARRWTERAAEGGDMKAMHNLALDYFEGMGGTKNTATAAVWFRRAAELGLVDSQFNLAQLYEEGFGVPQNPAEAYKWYLIAARAGDAQSRGSAQRLKGQLSSEAQAAAERAANGFLAQGGDGLQIAQAVAPPAPSSPTVTAQKALSRLGYYQGPTDGVSSPALKLAIAAYQRDQGVPASGILDQTLTDRLNAIAQ